MTPFHQSVVIATLTAENAELRAENAQLKRQIAMQEAKNIVIEHAAMRAPRPEFRISVGGRS